MMNLVSPSIFSMFEVFLDKTIKAALLIDKIPLEHRQEDIKWFLKERTNYNQILEKSGVVKKRLKRLWPDTYWPSAVKYTSLVSVQ